MNALPAHETASVASDNATTAEHRVSSERPVASLPPIHLQSLPPINFQEATIDEMRAPLARLSVPAFLQEATIEMRAPLAHLPVPSDLPKRNESFQTHTESSCCRRSCRTKRNFAHQCVFRPFHPPFLHEMPHAQTPTLLSPCKENRLSPHNILPACRIVILAPQHGRAARRSASPRPRCAAAARWPGCPVMLNADVKADMAPFRRPFSGWSGCAFSSPIHGGRIESVGVGEQVEALAALVRRRPPACHRAPERDGRAEQLSRSRGRRTNGPCRPAATCRARRRFRG